MPAESDVLGTATGEYGCEIALDRRRPRMGRFGPSSSEAMAVDLIALVVPWISRRKIDSALSINGHESLNPKQVTIHAPCCNNPQSLGSRCL